MFLIKHSYMLFLFNIGAGKGRQNEKYINAGL